MILERCLVNHGHLHRFIVNHDSTGWDVREEEDAIVIREVHLDDWHRVERAVQRFEQTVATLEEDGWSERA